MQNVLDGIDALPALVEQEGLSASSYAIIPCLLSQTHSDAASRDSSG